jgi:hypothetical protein
VDCSQQLLVAHHHHALRLLVCRALRKFQPPRFCNRERLLYGIAVQNNLQSAPGSESISNVSHFFFLVGGWFTWLVVVVGGWWWWWFVDFFDSIRVDRFRFQNFNF